MGFSFAMFLPLLLCICLFYTSLRRKSAHYYFIILVFAIGATTGALVTAHLGSQAIWGSSLLLLAGFILMFIKEQPVLC